MKISLYLDSDGSGNYTPDADEFLSSEISFTLNGEPGHYLFENLSEGDYIVRTDTSNFNGDGVLTGYFSTSGNSDPDNDINNDDNGTPMFGHGVVTKAVTLTCGREPVNDGDIDPDTNLTADFGFCQNEPPADPCDLILGGIVWHDADENGIYQPDSESGIDHVRLSLYRDSDGSGHYTPDKDEFLDSAISVTLDGELGRYIFNNLCEGAYIVQAVPANFDDNSVLNGYSNSTGNLIPGHGVVTRAISLRADEAPWVNFGFYQPASPDCLECLPMKPF